MLDFKRFNPFVMVISSFVFVALFGALVLMQPWATQSGVSTRFIDAFFISSSAIFVTGLTMFETGTYWSIPGQATILLLIQIGALGVVTIGGYIAYLLGQRLYYSDRKILSENLGLTGNNEVVNILKKIVWYFVVIESLGIMLLSVNFIATGRDLLQSIWLGTFHAISAFANAGFDILGRGDSVASLVNAGIALEIIMLLVVIGGLGFPVWIDLMHKFQNPRHLINFHSRVVLLVSGILIIGGGLAIYLLEQVPNGDLWTQWRTALFHSINARTAGFSASNLSEYGKPGQLIIIILMFIGGAPASTAGGVKVTSALLVFLASYNLIRGRLSINLFKRHITHESLLRAMSIVVVTTALIIASVMAFEVIDNPPLLETLFEATSAISTVGLSLGFTSSLSDAGKVIVIILMMMGRVGLYALMYGVIFSQSKSIIKKHYPTGEICQ